MHISESLHKRLKSVFHEFDIFCKEKGIFYDIVADEKDRQGYFVRDKSPNELEDFCQELSSNHDVHLEISKSKNGTLLTFTLDSIQDAMSYKSDDEFNSKLDEALTNRDPNGGDGTSGIYPEEVEEGHWRPLKGHPGGMIKGKAKREDYSAFADPKDARKVRAGKMPIQKKKRVKEDRDDHFCRQNGSACRDKSHQSTKGVSGSQRFDTPPDQHHGSHKFGTARPGSSRSKLNTAAAAGERDMGTEVVSGNMTDVNGGETMTSVYQKEPEVHWDPQKQVFKRSTEEDQYKNPTGKHRRSQSMYPSSFKKSKTFGGVSESKLSLELDKKLSEIEEDGVDKRDLDPAGVVVKDRTQSQDKASDSRWRPSMGGRFTQMDGGDGMKYGDIKGG